MAVGTPFRTATPNETTQEIELLFEGFSLRGWIDRPIRTCHGRGGGQMGIATVCSRTPPSSVARELSADTELFANANGGTPFARTRVPLVAVTEGDCDDACRTSRGATRCTIAAPEREARWSLVAWASIPWARTLPVAMPSDSCRVGTDVIDWPGR